MADRYTPYKSSGHEAFHKKGISPPPRESGTRLFTSQRKSRPIRGNNDNRGLGAQMEKEQRAHKVQTRSETRRLEQRSAMKLAQPDALLNAPTGPLEDRLPKERDQSGGSMEADLPAALRAPFKNYISSRLCQESFCPIATLVSYIC